MSVDAMTSAAAEELERLLSETEEQAAARAASRLRVDGNEAFALYGAGTLGRTILHRLRAAGIEPVAFADDTPEKQGTKVEGVEIMTPAKVIEQFGDRAVFVVTILNPLLRFVDARARLRNLGAKNVLSFLDVAWKYPESFLPYYQFELPQQVLSKRDRIRRAFDRLADEESRRQFVAQLRFRLFNDYDSLPENSRDDYFPPDLIERFPNDVVFVDCGAFDGDTVRRFLAHQGESFSAIHAFEPDARNCEALRRYVATLPAAMGARIHVHHAAVGDAPGKLTFNETGNMSAALSTSGNVEVDVVPLDAHVPTDRGPLYLKFDVEGAEWEALAGARKLLDARATLAISIYHRPDDLWELPLWVDDLALGYELYLRTQGEDGMDVICYGFPK